VLGDEALLKPAIAVCRHPVPFAYLTPFAKDAEQPAD
jgi:hypothetical protein